jgi:hypothetical protein
MSETQPQTHVRVAGFRVALVPHSPFVISRGAEGVLVSHGLKHANIRVVGDSLRYFVSGGAQSLRDVVVAADTDYTGPFRLETSEFICDWPEGYGLGSPDRDGPFLFDLLPEAAPEEPGAGSLVFMAGPYTQELCPSIDALLGQGQVEVAREASSADGEHEALEVEYAHRGATHRQRHTRFVHGEHVFVLTAQGPAQGFEVARDAATGMAQSLRFV